MSSEDLRWLIGIGVSAVLALAGIFIGIFRSLSASQKDGDDKLHERINRVKDEYVRRVDLDQRLQHFEATQAEIRTDIKAIRDALRAPPRRS